jgi:hypothetical protein
MGQTPEGDPIAWIEAHQGAVETSGGSTGAYKAETPPQGQLCRPAPQHKAPQNR